MGRARAGRDIVIQQAPQIDVGLVIAIAERQGYLAPDKAAALAEQVRRTQADLERIRAVLEVLPAERLTITTDCGMKQLPRVCAIGKLRSLVEGTAIVRKELGATG